MSDIDGREHRVSSVLRLAVFGSAFALLQGLWVSLEGTHVWRIWIEALNVGAATTVINFLSSEVDAVADGTRIRATGGGLNLLQGCDGAELLLLLTSAFLVAPLPLRLRIAGWCLGLVVAWFLNVARLVGLFYAWRTNPSAFDILHNYIGPVFLILILGLYVNGVLVLATDSEAEPGAVA